MRTQYSLRVVGKHEPNALIFHPVMSSAFHIFATLKKNPTKTPKTSFLALLFCLIQRDRSQWSFNAGFVDSVRHYCVFVEC